MIDVGYLIHAAPVFLAKLSPCGYPANLALRHKEVAQSLQDTRLLCNFVFRKKLVWTLCNTSPS